MKKVLFLAGSFLLPSLALAQGGGTNQAQLVGILTIVKNVLNLVIPIVVTLGVIYFIWAVIQYVTVKDEEERAKSRSHMIYGIIGLFVVVSIWGLIGFIGSTVGVGQGGSGIVPCVTDSDNNPYNGCQ